MELSFAFTDQVHGSDMNLQQAKKVKRLWFQKALFSCVQHWNPLSRFLVGPLRFGATVGVYLLCPPLARALGIGSVLAGGNVLGFHFPSHPKLHSALAPLAPFSQSVQAVILLCILLPRVSPSLWRSLYCWHRAVPLARSYKRVHHRASALRSRHQYTAAEELWNQHHTRAAEEIYQLLMTLKGFHLKFGQLLATETDLLPPQYTASLERLLDSLPPRTFKAVNAMLLRELKGPRVKCFTSMEQHPLSCTIISQAHRAVMQGSFDVVVKVQHDDAQKLMQQDLATAAAFVGFLKRSGFTFSVDLASVLAAYRDAVPQQLDFTHEASMMVSVSRNLAHHARTDPLVGKVIIPTVLPTFSTKRVLVMEYLDGVPLLDTVHMDQSVRHALVESLIAAYGAMILSDGLFHSDPQPANLLAISHQGEPHVALLDFSQVKLFSPQSRLRAAQLVVALASRDDTLVTSTLRALGVHIEHCSHHFEAVCGYLLFDTRMDMPEAFMSPADERPEAAEFRTTRVPRLPRDLFMMVRVITLLRGVLSSLSVDVSSALIWRSRALQILQDSLNNPSGMPSSASEQEDGDGDMQPRIHEAQKPLAPFTPTRSTPSDIQGLGFTGLKGSGSAKLNGDGRYHNEGNAVPEIYFDAREPGNTETEKTRDQQWNPSGSSLQNNDSNKQGKRAQASRMNERGTESKHVAAAGDLEAFNAPLSPSTPTAAENAMATNRKGSLASYNTTPMATNAVVQSGPYGTARMHEITSNGMMSAAQITSNSMSAKAQVALEATSNASSGFYDTLSSARSSAKDVLSTASTPRLGQQSTVPGSSVAQRAVPSHPVHSNNMETSKEASESGGSNDGVLGLLTSSRVNALQADLPLDLSFSDPRSPSRQLRHEAQSNEPKQRVGNGFSFSHDPSQLEMREADRQVMTQVTSTPAAPNSLTMIQQNGGDRLGVISHTSHMQATSAASIMTASTKTEQTGLQGSHSFLAGHSFPQQIANDREYQGWRAEQERVTPVGLVMPVGPIAPQFTKRGTVNHSTPDAQSFVNVIPSVYTNFNPSPIIQTRASDARPAPNSSGNTSISQRPQTSTPTTSGDTNHFDRSPIRNAMTPTADGFGLSNFPQSSTGPMTPSSSGFGVANSTQNNPSSMSHMPNGFGVTNAPHNSPGATMASPNSLSFANAPQNHTTPTLSRWNMNPSAGDSQGFEHAQVQNQGYEASSSGRTTSSIQSESLFGNAGAHQYQELNSARNERGPAPIQSESLFDNGGTNRYQDPNSATNGRVPSAIQSESLFGSGGANKYIAPKLTRNPWGHIGGDDTVLSMPPMASSGSHFGATSSQQRQFQVASFGTKGDQLQGMQANISPPSSRLEGNFSISDNNGSPSPDRMQVQNSQAPSSPARVPAHASMPNVIPSSNLESGSFGLRPKEGSSSLYRPPTRQTQSTSEFRDLQNQVFAHPIQISQSGFGDFAEPSSTTDDNLVNTVGEFTLNAPVYHIQERDLRPSVSGGQRALRRSATSWNGRYRILGDPDSGLPSGTLEPLDRVAPISEENVSLDAIIPTSYSTLQLRAPAAVADSFQSAFFPYAQDTINPAGSRAISTTGGSGPTSSGVNAGRPGTGRVQELEEVDEDLEVLSGSSAAVRVGRRGSYTKGTKWSGALLNAASQSGLAGVAAAGTGAVSQPPASNGIAGAAVGAAVKVEHRKGGNSKLGGVKEEEGVGSLEVGSGATAVGLKKLFPWGKKK